MRHIRGLFWKRVWRAGHRRMMRWRLLDFMLAMFSDDPAEHARHGFTVIAKAP